MFYCSSVSKVLLEATTVLCLLGFEVSKMSTFSETKPKLLQEQNFKCCKNEHRGKNRVCKKEEDDL